MLWPVQNLLVLVHLYGDQSASFEVSDLDGELCESDSKQFHEEFDTKTSAQLKCNQMMFTLSQPDQISANPSQNQLPDNETTVRDIACKFNNPNKTIKDLSLFKPKEPREISLGF